MNIFEIIRFFAKHSNLCKGAQIIRNLKDDNILNSCEDYVTIKKIDANILGGFFVNVTRYINTQIIRMVVLFLALVSLSCHFVSRAGRPRYKMTR